MSKNKISLIVTASGFAFAILIFLLLYFPLAEYRFAANWPFLNYQVFSPTIIVKFVAAAVIFGFLFGVFIMCGIIWSRAEQEKALSPIFTPLMTMLSATIGEFALGLIASKFVLGNIIVILRVIFFLAFAFIGARLSLRYQPKKPTSRVVRQLYIVTSAMFFVFIFASNIPLTLSPISGLSYGEKQQWAEQSFGSFYSKANQYLSERITAEDIVGKLKLIAPTNGANRLLVMPNGVLGTLTVESIGEKSQVTCVVNFIYTAEQSWEFSAKVLDNNNILKEWGPEKTSFDPENLYDQHSAEFYLALRDEKVNAIPTN